MLLKTNKTKTSFLKKAMFLALPLVLFGSFFLYTKTFAENTETTNEIHGNLWNPSSGYISTDGSDSVSFTLTLEKFPDYNNERKIHGSIWSPVWGPIDFESSETNYISLKQFGNVDNYTYHLCGTAWNAVLGFIDFPCEESSGDIVVNIENGGIEGNVWNPVIGYINFGNGGGAVNGFDLTRPKLTISRDKEYLSRRGNKINTLTLETSEYVDYEIQIKNILTDTIVKEFTGSLGDLYGNSTSIVWDGSNDDLNPEITTFPNLTDSTYGEMVPANSVTYHVLESDEKEFVPFFYQEAENETVLGFNGTSNYLEAPSFTELGFPAGSSMTLEAWIHPDYLSDDILPIISKDDGSNTGNYTLYVDSPVNTTKNNLIFKFRKENGANVQCETPANSVPRKRWSFVAVTHEFGNATGESKLYINDNQYECNLGINQGATPKIGGTVKIGKTNKDEKFFKGYIANLSIFGEKRAEDEIAQDLERHMSGQEPNMIAYYSLYNSVIANDGKYIWIANAIDMSKNKAVQRESAVLTIDNSPPLITNIELKYNVEPHFRRDDLGDLIMNGGDVKMFTTKTIQERDEDTNSYEISRDITDTDNAKIDLSFDVDGLSGFESIKVIPYIGALGPYSGMTDVPYDKTTPRKEVTNIGIYTESQAEDLQLQHMTIMVKDKAGNESQKTIEVINHLPKISVSKVSNISEAPPPKATKEDDEFDKVSCDKQGGVNGDGPYCQLIHNTLTVSNIAEPTQALIHDKGELQDNELIFEPYDYTDPILVINGVEGDELVDHKFTVAKDKIYYFNANESRDESGIYSYYFELKGGTDLLKTSFDPTLSYKFTNTTENFYKIYLQVKDTQGNISEYEENIIVINNDGEDPVANAGKDVIWPIGLPYFFDGTASTDNVQITPSGYKWDFLSTDGVNSTDPDFVGRRAVHTFTAPGIYTVTLTVSDASVNTSYDTMKITIKDEEYFDNSPFNPTLGYTNTDTAFHLDGISFNGVTSVVTFNADKLKNEPNGTIEFWMKPEGAPSTNATILELSPNNQTEDDKFKINLTPDLELEILYQKNGVSALYGKTNDPITSDKWTHVAFRFGSLNGGEYKNHLYLNETQITDFDYSAGGEDTVISFVEFADLKAILGKRYVGNFDELKIWNTARSDIDILKEMRIDHTGNENFLLYYIPFNQVIEYDSTKSVQMTGDISHGSIEKNTKLSVSSGDFSIGAWVKPEISSSINPIISKQKNHDKPGNYTIYIDTDNSLNFEFTDTGGNEKKCSTDANVISSDMWNYITLNHTFQDGTDTSFFVNSKKVDCTWNVLGNTTPDTSNVDVNVGMYSNLADGTDTNYFKGVLDTITIWKEKRSFHEIIQDMKGKISGNEENLIGYYRFEEGSGAKVQNEVSPHFGEMSLSNPFWTSDVTKGVVREKRTKLEENFTSLHLEENDYIEIDSADSNISSGDFTLEFWAKLPSTNVKRNIVSKKEELEAGAGFILFQNPDDDTITGKISNGTPADDITVSSNTELKTISGEDQWHHFALSLDRNTKTLSLFIDGKLDSQTTIGSFSGSLENSEDLYISKNISGIAGLTTDLTEFRLFDNARYEVEIDNHKNNRLTPDSGFYDSLKVYLKLNENGDNQEIFDYSKYNVNVTNVGGEFNDPALVSSTPKMQPANDLWWEYNNDKIDHSALLTNNESITITNGYSDLISNKSPLSIEFWTYVNDLGNYPYILSKENDDLFYIKINDNGSLEFRVDSNDYLLTEANVIKTGQWTHVAFVLNSDEEVEVFINGKSVYTDDTFDSPVTDSGKDLYIGRNNLDSNHLNGYISDFKIWDTSRSQSQILEFLRKRTEKSNTNYSDLLAYYKLDDDSSIILDSSSASSLSNVNGIIWSDNAPYFEDKLTEINSDFGHETTVVFSGNEYLQASNSFVADFEKNNFTVELWAKPTDTGTVQTILNKEEEIASIKYGYKFYTNTNGKLNLDLNDGYNQYTITSNTKITDGKWHHLSFSIDYLQLEAYLFVDGELQNPNDTKIIPLASLHNEELFTVGMYKGNEYFVGQLDSIRVSSTVRYLEDFLPLKYFQTDSYTLGLYNFDTGTGTDIKDSSAYGQHLTLSNGNVWWMTSTPNYSAVLNDTTSKLYVDNVNNTSQLGIGGSSFTIEFNSKVSNNSGTLINWTNGSEKINLDYANDSISVLITRNPSNTHKILEGSFDLPINDNKWHHFAISINRTLKNAYLFIDGIKRLEKINFDSDVAFNLLGNNIYLGSLDGTTNKIKGQLDNIRISNIARYSENFKPDVNYQSDEYTLAMYRFSQGDTTAEIANELGNTDYTLTSQDVDFLELNTNVNLYSVDQIHEASGHYLHANSVRTGRDLSGANRDVPLQGKIWNPTIGWLDFDMAEILNSNTKISSERLTPPQIKDYDPKRINKVYDLSGYFFSPIIGWTSLEQDEFKLKLDTRTGIITRGGTWNPVTGFFDWSGKKIDTLDIEAPILDLDPVYTTFLRSDISSISLSGRVTDRFGSGTAAVFYKLNDGGFKLAGDDSLDGSFSTFHTVVKGLQIGPNRITFKTVDNNGNTNDESEIIDIYRSYAKTIDFFSPHQITKVSWRGDESEGIKRIPSEVRIQLSNNEYFLNDQNANPPRYTWEIVDINGNRTADDHIYTIDNFEDGYADSPSNTMVKYARLLVEDTIGHLPPYLDGDDGFKVYTEVNNDLLDPWSVTDTFSSHLDGVEYYYNRIDTETINPEDPAFDDVWGKHTARFKESAIATGQQTDFKKLRYPTNEGENGEESNVILFDADDGDDDKDVKFRFSPGEDYKYSSFFNPIFDYIETSIPAQDSVVIEYKSIVTKNVNE